MQKMVIIGGGLSGLYAAYLLKEKYDITLLEARERIGGRILTADGHDLGPSWVWPHHTHIAALVRDLGLDLFRQYDEGAALYQVPGRTERFMPPPSSPAARVNGGLAQVVDRLTSQLDNVKICRNTRVSKIIQHQNCLSIKTDSGTYEADRVIVAMAPRVALNIECEPELPEHTADTLQAVPTWMGHSRKCVVTYDKAFWRKQGLSGFVFSQKGPMGEIHDACTENEAALFGFLASHASNDKLEQAVITQLVELFGPEAADYKAFHFHDWRADRLSAAEADRALREHPAYGYDVSAYDGRLHFISTEAAYQEGGCLEGALIAVRQLAQRL
jgi:monoamine oxidase